MSSKDLPRRALTVFVTGGSGFVGRHLLAALLEDARVKQVVALVRAPLSGPWAAHPRLRQVNGRLEDVAPWADALRQADVVYHLGADATFGNGAEYERVNTEPTRQMAEVLKQSKRLRNLVFASSIGAVDRHPTDRMGAPVHVDSVPAPTSAYGRSKLLAERALQDSGIPCTVLRLTWVYGPGMRRNSHLSVFLDMAARRHPVMHVDWPGAVSVIHVADAVQAMLAALSNRSVVGRTYFAAAHNVTLGKVCQCAWQTVHGRTPWQIPVTSLAPPVLARLHAHLPLTLTNLFLPYLCAEDPRFAADFGITEPRSLAQGLAELAATRATAADAWVITGANSGIGLALAHALSAQNVPLVLVDVATERLGHWAGDPRHAVVQADLRTQKGLDAVVAAVARFKVRALVNNAGVGFRGAIDGLTAEQFEKMLEVNCHAPFTLVRRCLPQLLQQGSAIVNVASSAGYMPLPGMSVYAASKAFVLSWSLALAQELADTNLVVTFSPSGTHTGFQAAAGVNSHNGKGLLSAETVAAQIVAAVQQGRHHVKLGPTSHIMESLSRLLPRSAGARLTGALFAKSR